MARGRTGTAGTDRAPAARRGADPGDADPRDVVAWALLALTVLLVVWELHPVQLLTNTTPVNGDLGAHLHEPWFLRHHLLGRGQISGWSQDAYAGYPIGTYYFPVSMVLAALLSYLLPFAIAFKLVSAAGAVAVPLAAFAFGRLTGRSRLASSCFAVATLPALLEPTTFFSGGSILSTVYGEYSYELGLVLGLLTLGVVWKGLSTGRYRSLAAVLLGLSVVAHLVTGAFTIVGVLLLFALRPARPRLVWLATVAVPAALLTAFWTVPFILRSPYSSGSGFPHSGPVASYLLPQTFAPVFLLALGGAVVAATRWRQNRSGVAVIALALVGGLGVALLPPGRVWNVRLLGIWLTMLAVLAGVALDAIGTGIDSLRRSGARGRTLQNPYLGAMAAPAVMLLLVPILWMTPISKGLWQSHETYLTEPDQADTVGYIARQYGGYQRSAIKGDYQRLLGAMSTLTAQHGCGRVQWEFDKGKPEQEIVFLLLLPYWTHSCLTSTYGLFVESSPTMPFTVVANSHAASDPYRLQGGLPYGPFDFARAVDQMRILGVRYYMATSDQAHTAAEADGSLTLLTTVSSTSGRPWWVYELSDSPVVQGLSTMPVVSKQLGSRSSWTSAGLRWFNDATPDSAVFAASGPSSWPRARRVDAAAAARPVSAPAHVSHVHIGQESMSFDVDRTGAPVLVRVSYFPNWKASGAEGPWRVTPNFMVVVPTSRHVTLRYGRTGVEWLGLLLTLIGIVLVVLLRNRPVDVPAEPEVVSEVAPPRPRTAQSKAKPKRRR